MFEFDHGSGNKKRKYGQGLAKTDLCAVFCRGEIVLSFLVKNSSSYIAAQFVAVIAFAAVQVKADPRTHRIVNGKAVVSSQAVQG